MPAQRTRLRLVLGVCAALLTACGGGGGGGPGAPQGPEGVLYGTYFVCAFGAEGGSPETAVATWGLGTADGLGALSASLALNETGAVRTPEPAGFTYAIGADQALATTMDGTTTFLGSVAADGSLALGGSFTFDARPGLLAYARPQAGARSEDLDGAYHVCLFALDPGTRSALSYWGTATFNGSGACSLTLKLNADGTILGPGAPLACPYAVGPDGSFAQTIQGGEMLEGAVLAGGDVVLACGAANGSWAPLLAVFVRKAEDASDSTLEGRYQLVGLDRSGDGFRSITGAATLDGHGLLVTTISGNTNGVLTLDEDATDAYAVAPDGTLTLDPGGEDVLGGVAPDGSFAVMAGPAREGSAPGLYLLLRR